MSYSFWRPLWPNSYATDEIIDVSQLLEVCARAAQPPSPGLRVKC